MTGIRTHGKPPRKPRLAPGHLEKYSLEAGRSVIEVASHVIALLFCPLKWRCHAHAILISMLLASNSSEAFLARVLIN
jgi:hypothetical protein